MSALREERCYGLSSGKVNVSVFFVKLTDSAARAISFFQNNKGGSSNPTICFSGDQGRITIPCSESKNEVRSFTFGVTNVASDNPHGSFDCFHHLSTGAAEELSYLGVIQKKMTVKATDDSYDKARQSMAQAEEETRSRGAIVIKEGGRYRGKKVVVRAPAPALASLARHQRSLQTFPQSSYSKKEAKMSKLKKSPCASSRRCTGSVGESPLRDRVAHLLALRPYKRPELILRLQKDGLTAADKDMLDSVLHEVCQLNSRDNVFVLKDALYKEVQKDWPGYTSGDQQLLKRILVRRLFQPHQSLLLVPEAQVSPLRDTPNSSPAHSHKHSLSEMHTDPLLSKKPRISHLSRKTSGSKSRLRPSERVSHKDVRETREDDVKKSSLAPRKLLDSLSAVSQQEAEEVNRLAPTPPAPEKCNGQMDRSQIINDLPRSSLKGPSVDRHTFKRKKSKHQKDRWKDRKEKRKDCSSEDPNNSLPLDYSDISINLSDSDVLQAANDATDYLSKYTAITSQDQRQSYKQDFNKEYGEYRELHARIDSVTQQFIELGSELKRLHRGSHKAKKIHNQVLQEYQKIKKSNPNYGQDKIRCEYLHNKLSHIKKLISEYDFQQLSMDSSSSH
ncbi:RNA polymerase II elongation factor ELL-like isoform X2 [Thalassophryne amazonica]|uniref:RNA polymerase II elongation factor ELL-like isoform X2 n=1 Tax=Thalassophryne amazonica TaxID=390379 RepID=UPI001471F0D0|nr:RNA polymerase II elongation factor ELL-like isoform X2 [Thalassophryne amazonica]